MSRLLKKLGERKRGHGLPPSQPCNASVLFMDHLRCLHRAGVGPSLHPPPADVIQISNVSRRRNRKHKKIPKKFGRQKRTSGFIQHPSSVVSWSGGLILMSPDRPMVGFPHPLPRFALNRSACLPPPSAPPPAEFNVRCSKFMTPHLIPWGVTSVDTPRYNFSQILHRACLPAHALFNPGLLIPHSLPVSFLFVARPPVARLSPLPLFELSHVPNQTASDPPPLLSAVCFLLFPGPFPRERTPMGWAPRLSCAAGKASAVGAVWRPNKKCCTKSKTCAVDSFI